MSDRQKSLVTDWKQVADELYIVIVGMASASAQINGRSIEDAQERMAKLRDDVIKHNTKRSSRTNGQ